MKTKEQGGDLISQPAPLSQFDSLSDVALSRITKGSPGIVDGWNYIEELETNPLSLDILAREEHCAIPFSELVARQRCIRYQSKDSVRVQDDDVEAIRTQYIEEKDAQVANNSRAFQNYEERLKNLHFSSAWHLRVKERAQRIFSGIREHDPRPIPERYTWRYMQKEDPSVSIVIAARLIRDNVALNGNTEQIRYEEITEAFLTIIHDTDIYTLLTQPGMILNGYSQDQIYDGCAHWLAEISLAYLQAMKKSDFTSWPYDIQRIDGQTSHCPPVEFIPYAYKSYVHFLRQMPYQIPLGQELPINKLKARLAYLGWPNGQTYEIPLFELIARPLLEQEATIVPLPGKKSTTNELLIHVSDEVRNRLKTPMAGVFLAFKQMDTLMEIFANSPRLLNKKAMKEQDHNRLLAEYSATLEESEVE